MIENSAVEKCHRNHFLSRNRFLSSAWKKDDETDRRHHKSFFKPELSLARRLLDLCFVFCFQFYRRKSKIAEAESRSFWRAFYRLQRFLAALGSPFEKPLFGWLRLAQVGSDWLRLAQAKTNILGNPCNLIRYHEKLKPWKLCSGLENE